MKAGLVTFLICATTLASGCAVQGRRFERAEAAPGTAVIYVYRPYSYAGSLLKPSVTCGDDTARIGPGGYHAFVEPAGKIDCSIESSESKDDVELLADPRVYYIREQIVWGWLTGHPHLNPMDKDTGQAEIQHCCVEEEQPAQPTP